MSAHTITAKTIEDRLVYVGAATTATDGTSDISSNAISVPVGKKVTMVWAVTTVTGGNYWHKAYLQGSIDNVSFCTLQTIECDANNSSTTADLTAAGTIAKTHNPATYGDFPYYRITTDAENASGGHVGTLWLLIT